MIILLIYFLLNKKIWNKNIFLKANKAWHDVLVLYPHLFWYVLLSIGIFDFIILSKICASCGRSDKSFEDLFLSFFIGITWILLNPNGTTPVLLFWIWIDKNVLPFVLKLINYNLLLKLFGEYWREWEELWNWTTDWFESWIEL